jgi:FlaA1/EpsC-like NDP-sugar epimerase
MQRYALVATQVVIDLSVLAAAFAMAFALRFDGAPPADMVGRLALTLPYVVVGEYAVLAAFGVRRFSWRFVGLREIATIFAATLAAGVGLFAIRLVLGAAQFDVPYLRHGVIPAGVIAANTVLAFLAVSGVRVGRRLIGERVDRVRRPSDAARPKTATLLVGAGQAGVMMARELASRPELGIQPVGFVDDDVAKIGTVVHGIRVLGSIADLGKHATERGARQVIVTMASAPGKTIRNIVRLAEEAGLPTKIVPGLWELADGSVNVSRIREVAIEDLLGREPVQLDEPVIAESIRGHTVAVTGAGGSIGSELCRQVLRFAPRKILLMERSENALFQIHRELLRDAQCDVVPLVADVTDRERVRAIFELHRPELVLHAAAHKHVPMMEDNPGEALKNNVLGTATVAEAADAAGVARFVMISTDKAVNPTSVMGASKRVAEMFVQSLASRSTTRFVTVRFGNVLGSAGSVVPIFREQILAGGPVTVTHPEMRRYFMTIPEACQLVLQAGAMGQGGEIFVLDMGEPMKIVELARDLIRLSGLRPDEDIEIVFSGVRPGEKLFEEIATDEERAEKTRHPKIFTGKNRSPDHDTVRTWVSEIPALVRQARPEVCVAFLQRVIPEFQRPAPASAPAAPREPARVRLDTPAVGLAD